MVVAADHSDRTGGLERLGFWFSVLQDLDAGTPESSKGEKEGYA
jgi:hypothetical protein